MLPDQTQVLKFHRELKDALVASSTSVPASITSKVSSTPILASAADESSGLTPLILSSKNAAYTAYLLASGAPWNALDRAGKCAGNHASEAGCQEVVDLLVSHATRSEVREGAENVTVSRVLRVSIFL